MSELEFRFPSDQPYAYFAVRGTPEELAQLDFETVAALYVNTQYAVLKGTVNAKDAILGAGDSPPEAEAPPGDPVAAAERLADGRKPRTVPEAEEMDRQALEALSKGLDGATEIEDVNAPPWNDKPKAAKPKAWEQPKPKTQVDVSSGDFDFGDF